MGSATPYNSWGAFKLHLLGFKHKCTACSDMEGKGKAAATSRSDGVSYL